MSECASAAHHDWATMGLAAEDGTSLMRCRWCGLRQSQSQIARDDLRAGHTDQEIQELRARWSAEEATRREFARLAPCREGRHDLVADNVNFVQRCSRCSFRVEYVTRPGWPERAARAERLLATPCQHNWRLNEHFARRRRPWASRTCTLCGRVEPVEHPKPERKRKPKQKKQVELLPGRGFALEGLK